MIYRAIARLDGALLAATSDGRPINAAKASHAYRRLLYSAILAREPAVLVHELSHKCVLWYNKAKESP